MLKGVAAVLVISGTSGVGISFYQEQKNRLYHLKYMKYIMVLIQNEIAYRRASFPEICQSIVNRMEKPYVAFFTVINKELSAKDGKTFGEIWRNAGKQLEEIKSISKAEREQFLSFPTENGYQDGEMQIREMESKICEWETSIQRLEKKIENNSKLYLYVGIMSGLLCTILFW